MRRKPFRHTRRSTHAAAEIVRLARSLGASGSRVEDEFWSARLDEAIGKALAASDNASLAQALDQLYDAEGRAYDQLADLIEAGCEGERGLLIGGERYDALLVAAPLLAWSRYEVPAKTIPDEMLANLRVQLQAHVLAGEARIGIADFLFSPDQLPAGYAETRELAGELWQAAAAGQDLEVPPRSLPESQHFIADARYLLIGAIAPAGRPLFRWQESGATEATRESALEAWRAQGAPCLQPMLTGCGSELLLPDAFHAAWRHAERELRPFSLRSAVLFLTATLHVGASGLRAVVAPFYDRILEEHRIGFTLKDSGEVVHGVVWPLVGAEDELTETTEQIATVLREAGVAEISALEQRLPLEYCDDCGAPLFPNPDGEPVHAELPDSATEVHSPLH
jgi:hypothetical protein